MEQNQVFNLPPQEPDENTQLENQPPSDQIHMYDDSQGLSKYAIPQREGFTMGAAGIAPQHAESLGMAMTQKRFNRIKNPEENLPEDHLGDLL